MPATILKCHVCPQKLINCLEGYVSGDLCLLQTVHKHPQEGRHCNNTNANSNSFLFGRPLKHIQETAEQWAEREMRGVRPTHSCDVGRSQPLSGLWALCHATVSCPGSPREVEVEVEPAHSWRLQGGLPWEGGEAGCGQLSGNP